MAFSQAELEAFRDREVEDLVGLGMKLLTNRGLDAQTRFASGGLQPRTRSLAVLTPPPLSNS